MPESSTDNTIATAVEQPTVSTPAVENTPAPQTDAKPDSSTVDTGVKAESPPAENKAEKKETLIDRIRNAANKVSEVSSPETKEVKKEPDSPEDAALKDVEAKDGAKMSNEDLKGLHPKTRERMQNLLTKLSTRDRELGEEKKVADKYRHLETTMQRDNITYSDANQAFEIMRDFTKDPPKALKALDDLRDKLMLITGQKLPDDLATQVNSGMTTEAVAKETARLRLEAGRRQQEDKSRADALAEQQRKVAEVNTNEIVSATAEWEKNWKKSDPDYQRKSKGVLDKIELRLSKAAREGKLPKTKAEAVKMAEDAKKEYEAEISSFIPKKREITHITGGSVSNIAPERPKNTADAIMQRINKQ